VKYEIKLGKLEDDEQIRSLLRNNPMPGTISLSYEKNPSFFNTLKYQGYKHHVVVAKIRQKVIGFASCSLQKLYINGREQVVGYLSNLRVDKAFQRQGVLTNGIKFLKDLKLADYYFTTIVDDNVKANKIFKSGKKGFPYFNNLGRLNTYIIFLNRQKHKTNIIVEKCRTSQYGQMIEFINRNHSKHNFSSNLSKGRLSDYGLKPTDFYIARKNNKIAGVVCCWDQSAFKQSVVRGYSSMMHLFRLWHNFTCKINGNAPLPKLNKHINFLYLSFLAIEKDNPVVLNTIISYLKMRLYQSKYLYLVMGLHESSKLNRVMKHHKHMNYKSMISLVSWKKQTKLLHKLRGSIYIDIARL